MFNSGNTSKNVRGTSVVDGSLENADFPDDGISGNKVHGGTISNFKSTGFDDTASTTKKMFLAANGSLVVSDSAWAWTADTIQIGYDGVLYSGRSTTNDSYAVRFFNANGNVGSIKTNGAATSYNTSSDYRLKENVVTMSGSIDRIKALKPYRFNFIADPTKTVDGFLAHEVQEVIPEAVSGEKDAMKTEEYEVTPALGNAIIDNEIVQIGIEYGRTPLGSEWIKTIPAVTETRTVEDYQGIDQSKLVPLLVGALQEAIARIETLEGAAQ